MAATILTFTRLPSPARELFSRWATSQVRPSFFTAHAAGKGFGELPKQRKRKGKDQEVPLSPGRGFGENRISKENDAAEASRDDHDVCSCGGGNDKLSYTHCCMPYHQGTASAPDGLSLLRARFSAYARGIIGYIVSTTHPENPDYRDELPANAHATCDQFRFYKLEILQYEPISDKESTVSFRAIFGRRKQGQGDRRVMEEKSYFVREGDTWLFRDGEALRKPSEAELLPASTANKAGKS